MLPFPTRSPILSAILSLSLSLCSPSRSCPMSCRRSVHSIHSPHHFFLDAFCMLALFFVFRFFPSSFPLRPGLSACTILRKCSRAPMHHAPSIGLLKRCKNCTLVRTSFPALSRGITFREPFVLAESSSVFRSGPHCGRTVSTKYRFSHGKASSGAGEQQLLLGPAFLAER